MMFGGLHHEGRIATCGDLWPQREPTIRLGALLAAIDLDGLGRTILEERQYLGTGGVTTADRAMGYNAMGWKTSTELWDSTRVTTIAHDRFGRVRTITPPDPSLAPTVFKYTGERRIERSDKVATEAGGGETYICYREDYDAFGRLLSVAENLASNAAGDCSPGATGWVTTTPTTRPIA